MLLAHWQKRLSAAVVAHTLAAAALLLLAAPALAATPLSPADQALLHRVDAHYNHLHTLRTDFTETWTGLGLHREETGTLLLARPGRMRWSYTSPAGKLFVTDGHFAYSYSPGDAQAQRLSSRQLDDLRSPLRLLLGHTELQHELRNITVAPAPDNTATVSGDAPPEAHFARLTLQVTQAGSIQALTVTEPDGATTAFTFRNTADDVPTKPADFVFSPPIGVPIIDGLPPI